MKEFILKLLEFAMEHNYFYFGGEFYLQSTGVAMGAKFAPSLANLFMALWENDFLFSREDSRPFFWRLYIDDAIFLWGGRGDVESLHKFMEYLNSNQWGVRFTYQFSTSSIPFLDLVIYREQNSLWIKTQIHG